MSPPNYEGVARTYLDRMDQAVKNAWSFDPQTDEPGPDTPEDLGSVEEAIVTAIVCGVKALVISNLAIADAVRSQTQRLT